MEDFQIKTNLTKRLLSIYVVKWTHEHLTFHFYQNISMLLFVDVIYFFTIYIGFALSISQCNFIYFQLVHIPSSYLLNDDIKSTQNFRTKIEFEDSEDVIVWNLLLAYFL